MVDLDQLRSALTLYSNPKFVVLEVSPELRVIVDAARLYLAEHEGPPPASYDIEIPDFVNRHGTW